MQLVQVDRKYKKMIQDYKDEYMESNSRINGGCGLHHYSNLDDCLMKLIK